MRAVVAAMVLVLGVGVALMFAPGSKQASATSGEAMTELRIRDVVPLNSVQKAAVILSPVKGDLIVPVLVSPDEGEAISNQLSGHTPDAGTLGMTIAGLGGKLVRVELPALKGDSVQAQLVVETHGRSVVVEGNPADVLGLALAAHVPVMASHAVMAGLGLTRAQIRALVREHPGSGSENKELDTSGAGSIPL